MQDLIKTERRSVRNISIDKPTVMANETAGDNNSSESETMINNTPPTRPPFGTIGNGSRSSSKKWWWIIGGVIVLIILLVTVGSVFSGATITITPRQTPVNLDNTFTAYLDPAPGDVGFEIVSVSQEASRTVKATGSEQIDHPASGTITIYNDYGEEPQKLIVNTRFESPEGLIYRIPESVTVPGRHTDSTGATVPGSIEAKVFADSAGEEYNIDLTTFTIPGFEEGGDLERFQKFHAKSKTQMTGGFSGTVPTASDEDTEAAETALEAELTETFGGEALTTLPEGFVIVPDSASYSFETLPNEAGEDDTVVITVRGESKMLAINSADVARNAAMERIQGYTGEPVAFADASALSFAPVDASEDTTTGAESTLIRVSGSTTLVWTFDTDELRERLAGISRSDTKDIFDDYPGIDRADVVVRPFWKRSLPDDIEEINVKITPAL